MSGDVDYNEVHNRNDDTRQFITFNLGDEEYGVHIMSVREIKGWSDTRKMPNTPQFVRGVINLRGEVLPIFDLRARFGLGETDPTATHVVIIINVNGHNIGILVDGISDIVTVHHKNILPVPKMDQRPDEEYLSGIIMLQERMIAILAPEKLFDYALVEQAEALVG